MSGSNYQIAELNIGALVAPIDSPEIKDFVDNLDRINALAEGSPGFVWRLVGDGNDATSLRPLGEDVIVNLSVWQDIPSLTHYVYKTAHVEILKRRREWFSRMRDMHMVLWWVPRGHTPSVEEAVAKLQYLRKHGPSPEAFTFGEAYSAPDAGGAEPFSIKDTCPA